MVDVSNDGEITDMLHRVQNKNPALISVFGKTPNISKGRILADLAGTRRTVITFRPV